MNRRLLNFLTAISLVLCVAGMALWVRGLWLTDYVDRSDVEEEGTSTVITKSTFSTMNGNLRFDYSWQRIPTEEAGFAWPSGVTWKWEVFEPASTWWTRFDLESDSSVDVSGGVAVRSVELPHWLPVAVFGLAPALSILRRLSRRPPGHCRCGYDLTGNISGVCPECGARIPRLRA